MRLIRSLRDRILKTVLPDIDAGACIPEMGCCCFNASNVRLNCTGQCVISTSCTPWGVGHCQ